MRELLLLLKLDYMIARSLLINIVVKQSNHNLTIEYKCHYSISYPNMMDIEPGIHSYLTIWSYDTTIVYK